MSEHISNVTFHDRVDDALRNQILHTALDRATGRFQSLRANALAELQDADVVRDRARLIRAHTLSKLDTYLEQFVANVEKAGGHVHFARDANALNEIVNEIARTRNVRGVVKGKSMISEETHLNHALEAEHIRVVETDLGEYIVQLAGETPSHIVAPAIHKTKEEIGELFHQKINIPYTDDPALMTAAARHVLRREFLDADMGISGVNFGVAETGSICLVENEGNGRLTTTAPRIHVALMGIERLVPNLDDLSVMLQVLARSSTGQKITVYTNLITGPRQDDEGDGPDELHVILLDNGRSKVLATEVAEILYCIRCGACLNACPVYREIGGHAYGSVYTGPVGAVLTPALEGIAPWSDLPHASSLCGACRQVCPVRIDIPRMLLVERDWATRAGKLQWWLRLGLRMYSFTVTRPTLFKLATTAGRWGSRLVGASSGGWIRSLPPPLNGWTQSRDFPAFAQKSFSEQFEASRKK
ncbi:MAG: iron-sulfur cluster-binding protein [Anaerolineae bacterium]|nr:iron-sulfur cluster-binding protein [Anaerolineae bacterium]